MHLGAIYLVVNDFEKSIKFYEKILQIPVTQRNMDRFAMFCFEGNCIAIMNGHFDTENPDKVEHRGKYEAYFDDMKAMAAATNTHKFVLNFWTENLEKEHKRIMDLHITSKITPIKYVCNVSPYYYFQFTDPDGNIIEVTGEYHPKENEFEEWTGNQTDEEQNSYDVNILLSNLGKLHTTEMGAERIKRNLGLNMSDVVEWCRQKIQNKESWIIRQGKNWYITAEDCKITVNAHSYTIITAHIEKHKK